MRYLLVAALALVLALPAVAVAERAGGGDRSTSSGRSAKAAKKRAKLERAAVGARAAKLRKQERQRLTIARSVSGDEREARGPIVTLAPLTVGTVSCVVPAGLSLAGFAVGDTVEMTCDLVGGQWTLRKLHHEDAANGDDEVEVEGLIVSLAPLTVGTVSCVVPAGLSLAGFAVGDTVEMTCDLVGGQWTLGKLHHEDDHPSAGDDDDRDDDSGHGRGDDDDDDDDESGPDSHDDD